MNAEAAGSGEGGNGGERTKKGVERDRNGQKRGLNGPEAGRWGAAVDFGGGVL